MTKLEDILKQIEDFPQAVPQQELAAELKKKSREIGKRQGGISPSSEEYGKLDKQRELIDGAIKMLHEKAIEESGLVPAGTTQNQKQDEITREEMERWYNKYQKAEKENRQRMYREVSMRAENGDRNAVVLLAMTYSRTEENNLNQFQYIRLLKKAAEMKSPVACQMLYEAYITGNGVIKNTEKSKKYLKEVIRYGNKEMHLKYAQALKNGNEIEGYEKNIEQAYEEYKAYILRFGPLDMDKDEDRKILYDCYWCGYSLGKHMDKENIPQKLELLMDGRSYAKEAAQMKGMYFRKQGKYEDAVQLYLASGVDGIKEIEKLFFENYFTERRELQTKLDIVLKKMTKDSSVDDDIRAELYFWYGERYEEGNGVVQDNLEAFICYYKANELNSNYGVNMETMLENAVQMKDISFLKDAFEEGCNDVAEALGNWYQEKGIYEKALFYYKEGYEKGIDESARDICRKKYTKLQKKINQRNTYIEECEAVYIHCNTKNVGRKKESFERMRLMAKKGNTYACLRVAQVAERDGYLKENAIYLPTEEEIFQFYLKAAEAEEGEAVIRMVEIYRDGLLGQKKDSKKQYEWEQKI